MSLKVYLFFGRVGSVWGALARCAIRGICEQVAPPRQPGQLVGMDNLSAQKAARIREALVARGKAIQHGLGARTQATFQEAVCLAVAAITSANAAAWYAYAGYPLPAQPI